MLKQTFDQGHPCSQQMSPSQASSSSIVHEGLLDLHRCAVKRGQNKHAAALQYNRSKQTVHVPSKTGNFAGKCLQCWSIIAGTMCKHTMRVQWQKHLMTAAINATLMRPNYSHVCLHLALEPEPEHLTRLHYWAAAQGQQQQWFQ